MHVIMGMRRYDPTRASRLTFADQIVTSKLITMRQHQRAKKRDRRRLVHVNGDEAGVVDATDLHHSREMRLDVQSALSRLPAELRAIATLFKTFSEAEVVKRSGLSRQRVRGIKAKLAQSLAHLRN